MTRLSDFQGELLLTSTTNDYRRVIVPDAGGPGTSRAGLSKSLKTMRRAGLITRELLVTAEGQAALDEWRQRRGRL